MTFGIIIAVITFVHFVWSDLCGGMLDLQKKLDPLDGCYGRFRDGCRHTTGYKVDGEGLGVGYHGCLVVGGLR